MNKHKTHNKIYSNPFKPGSDLLIEGLEYKDLDGLMKPTVFVDEFSAKMGDDDDIIVVSFFVRDQQAAKDLMSWFEKGYDFVLDADRSPGEIKPGRWLVYIELRRRSTAGNNINRILDDLASLTEFEPSDWRMRYRGREFDWDPDVFDKVVPLTPEDYRQRFDSDLNEMRTAAGIPPKPVHEPKTDTRALQAAAGIR